METKSVISPSLAKWSLAGLVAGFGVGILGLSVWTDPTRAFSNAIAPFGSVWINALQMTVIPLVLTQLLAALVRPGEASSLGRLGTQTVGTIVGMLVGFGVLTLLFVPHFLDPFSFPPSFAQTIIQIETPQGLVDSAPSPGGGLSGWIVGLVPPNAFEAAVRGDLIQLMVFTVLLGLAAGRLPEERRNPLAELFRSFADAMLVLVGWVLWITPFGIFSLMLAFTLEAGAGVVGVSILFVGLLCGILVFATLLLYPLTVLFGKISPMAFARAVLPGQIIAAGTQSSLATLPALIEEGRNRLDLTEGSTGFALPFCASVFKLNLVVSQTFTLLFFARVFGIDVGWGIGLRFLLGIILLGVSYPGLPRGAGMFRSLPLFLAAGIPAEAVVLYEAVKTIPDVFYTILNSTSYMSVATIVSRGGARALRLSEEGTV